VLQLRRNDQFDDTRDCRRNRVSRRRAFTIMEVMMAAAVLVLGISSALVVLQQGLRTIDTARVTTLAGQVLQTQIEKLRLLTWAQLTSPDNGPTAYSSFAPDLADGTPDQLNRFTVGSETGKCRQSITDAPPPFAASMKVITLTAAWTGLDGRQHSLSYTTRYAQNGISDFFYSHH